MTRARSEALFERAQKSIPGGVNSPVRAFRGVGGKPLFIARGEGSHIFDADRNENERRSGDAAVGARFASLCDRVGCGADKLGARRNRMERSRGYAAVDVRCE